MENRIDSINKRIKEGELVITDIEFLNDEIQEQHHQKADTITAPTMSTLFRLKSQEFMDQKKESGK